MQEGLELKHTCNRLHVCSGFLHPNLNLEDPEEDVDLNILVGSEKQKFDINVALSNSFGFGGHNSCILFRKFTK